VLKLLPRFLIASVINLLLVTVASAHEEEATIPVQLPLTPKLDEVIASVSSNLVISAFLIIAVFVILTVLVKEKGDTLKKILFGGIVLPVIIVTIFLVGSTIYLNLSSATGGPVHWHADFQVWNCGQKVDLVDPQGLSNKVGTATFHEHNDDRIHVEGVVINRSDASLGNFFKFIDGEFSSDDLKLETTRGLLNIHDGDLCPNDQPGSLQTFLYATKNGIFNQIKLKNPQDYIISPYGSIPPGDCIIIEFDSTLKEKTDKLCDSYKLHLEKEEIRHGS